MNEESSFNIVGNQKQNIINNQMLNSRRKSSTDEKISIKIIKEQLKTATIEEPLDLYKSQIMPLEKELFENINLEWGVDIISEDIPLTDINQKYYCHLIRTANPDPNKDNFFLIHGMFSSGMHFFSLIPYLIKRYNIFIPDTIGMGLSSRPQVEFTSAVQCEEYFLSTYHIIIENIFFGKKFNIKKEYYLCGHSLGGLIASKYMLKYPKGIKKALLLSPIGITDYRNRGTNMSPNISCKFYCGLILSNLCWPCKINARCLYKNCCFGNSIKNFFMDYNIYIDKNEIKKNKDGTEFDVNEKRIKDVMGKLGVISLEYPDDLYNCAYYLFTNPPVASLIPIENSLVYLNTIDIVFVYGKDDWMDKIGAYRLNQYNPNRYRIYTTNEGGHSFALEKPKELYWILEQYFSS